MPVKNISDGRAEGCTMGQDAADLVSLYAVTPVAQAATIASVTTTAATSTTNAFGYTTSTQADAIVTVLNSVLTALKNLGAIAAA